MSLLAEIWQPGGGMILIPFIQGVLCILMLLTATAAYFDVARIHMVILSFLSCGLVASLSFFKQQLNAVNNSKTGPPKSAGGGATSNKTD